MTIEQQPPAEETFLQRMLRRKAEQEADQARTVPTPRPGPVLDSENYRARRWADRKLEQVCADLALTPEGGRNHALNAAAYTLGRHIPKWLDQQHVTDQLRHAALTAGLDPREADLTIRSGLAGGMDDPRDPPVDPHDNHLHALVDGPVRVILAPTGTDPQPQPQVEGMSEDEAAELAARAHAARVTIELHQLRARHDAKQQHTAELAARTFRAPAYTHTLTDELLIPEEPVSYAVADLLPNGGNALLAAQFKAGKTTLVTNLLRAYADEEPFLGKFTVTPGDGRIAIFNYELSPEQYRRWLRAAGIRNTDRVAVLHLRGYRLPITAQSVEDWIVNWLVEHEVTFWIADPFARAATGTDENSNTEVGVWLDTFDVIKERAGVSEAVLPTHTGRAEQEQGQERARGATRLDDWADVRWLLTKDDEDNRFFRATGRDVDLAEELLTFDPDTRGLSFGGGDRRWVKSRALAQAVLDFIVVNPKAGVKAIQNGVKGNKDQIDAARQDLIRRHKVRVEDGPRGALHHYANEVEA